MNKFYNLIGEGTSPLNRISFTNSTISSFENACLATHIGNGYFITVNHPLNMMRLPRIIPVSDYKHLMARSPETAALFNNYYIQANEEMVINPNLPPMQPEHEMIAVNQMQGVLNQSGYDSTYLTEIKKGYIKPVVVITFRNRLFFNDAKLTEKFESSYILNESLINRTSFIIDLELVATSYNDDVAIYKAINVDSDVLSVIPKVSLDFTLLDFSSNRELYCLQCAPNSEFGKTLNKSCIEGIVDNLSIQNFGKVHDGNRYLLKTYFRFGSSGAPYLTYNDSNGQFCLNAIQSEACPIQMDINGMRNGMQYTHALATPIANIKSIIDKLNLNNN